jgi:hypothetical protein
MIENQASIRYTSRIGTVEMVGEQLNLARSIGLEFHTGLAGDRQNPVEIGVRVDLRRGESTALDDGFPAEIDSDPNFRNFHPTSPVRPFMEFCSF